MRFMAGGVDEANAMMKANLVLPTKRRRMQHERLLG